jgi:predicted RNA-binding Zn-ribbon protein involved in translation (DUF1610 family)
VASGLKVHMVPVAINWMIHSLSVMTASGLGQNAVPEPFYTSSVADNLAASARAGSQDSSLSQPTSLSSCERQSPTGGRRRKVSFFCPFEVCGRHREPFKNNRSLERHLDVHKSLKQECPNCGQILRSRKDNLKRHMTVHWRGCDKRRWRRLREM